MLTPFARLGLFLQENFVTTELAAAVVAEMLRDPGSAAEVFAEPGHEIAPATRHATERTPGPAASAIDAAFDASRPALERCFGGALGMREPTSFVTYERGQYYRPHVDCGPADRAAAARDRAVSVVLFLNDGASAIGFDGGALVFYDLLDDARARGIGFPLEPRAGLLVAFRSDVLHEVAPVTGGVRAVAVTWFHQRAAGASTIVGASGSVRW